MLPVLRPSVGAAARFSRGSPTRRTATQERYKAANFFFKDAGFGSTLGCGSSKNSGQGAGALAEFVTIEKGLGPDGRIAVVRLDRGDGINALSPEALRQLTDAARHFEDDSETSAVVLTGGPKAFSAGFDLKDAEGRSRGTMDIGALRRHLKLGPRLTRAWQEIEQITIGAIVGFCIGGGVALAVALDFRVMARDEIGLGMNMSWQSVPRMLHLIGPARTKQAVILADQRISAVEAYEWGLVEEVGRCRRGFRRRDGARNKSRSTAAAVGRDDKTDRQPPRACARRSRRPYGRRPVRAGEFYRGPQGGRGGVSRQAQAAV
jgi:enoyl-CoA hydratase